jgi:PKD repeat protein
MKQGLLSNNFFFLFLLMLVGVGTRAQVVADFTCPDTVIVGQQVNLTNLSIGATTYYWSFCSGSLGADPVGTNLGNVFGNLDVPTYITLVKDGDKCYSFISNQGYMLSGDVPHVTRNYLGNSFLNYPVSSDKLNGSGLFNTIMEGIQVKKDNDTWYGFVNNENSVVRLVFGSSLSNSPVASVLNIPGLALPHGMWIGQEGDTWIGFITCTDGNKLVRLNFGNTLANSPTVEDMGTLSGLLYQPSSIVVINDNGVYRMFANGSNSTLVRLDFGNSLLNWPTGVNLGNFSGSMNNGGLVSTLQDCETTTGFMTKYLESYESQDLFWRINFAGGYTGTITMQSLGNIGDLDRPHSMSEIIREGDKLCAYITNRGSYTLTKLVWPMCSNATIPSSTLFTPPAFAYNVPGTYHISLTVDEGLQTKSVKCRQIVVVSCSPPVANFTYTVEYPSVTFTDASSQGNSWLWDFGDGSSSSDKNPIHVYLGPGTYHVCLTVTDSCGTGTECKAIVLSCRPPLPGFTTDIDYLNVRFTNTTTPDALAYLWFFGDGTSSTQHDPEHSYPNEGNYKVCLIASNECGSDSLFREIQLICKPPESHFYYTTNYPEYLFHDTSTVSGFISRIWDFGDGNTSTDPNPVHVYIEEGTYLACLTVVDSCGESFSCNSVYVYPLLTKYSQNIVPGTDLEVQFRIETPNATSWHWDFGDGSTSMEKDPLHTYGDYGEYKINLIVSNSNLQNSVCQQLKLLPLNQENWTGQVTLYPNPSNGTFFIGVTSDIGEAVLSVTDISGKVILFKNIPFIRTSEPVQTNLSNLVPGVYIVDLRFNGTEKMWKMIVK